MSDLRALLACFSEVVIGTRHICRQPDHCAQIDFVKDAWLGEALDTIVWANRAGSKTYLAGGTCWWYGTRFDLYEVKILGGSEEQSAKSYKAMDDFWRMSGLQKEVLAEPPRITETRWRNGSTVSILTASSKSVRGPHPQRLILDEVDEMDPEIYTAALSQPISKHGHQASINIFSTNHNIGGTMDKVLDDAQDRGGWKIYKYCVWEVVDSCAKSGLRCSTCPLTSICPGEQVKKADGYMQITDLVKKMQQISNDAFNREWLCIKVGKGDTVYQDQFDEDVHIVNEPYDSNGKVVLSIDWGGTHPYSVGVWQYRERLRAWVRVDELYMANTDNTHVIKAAKLRDWWEKVEEAFCDPARPDSIREWRAQGVKISGVDNDVDEGIEGVKRALKPALGAPRIYINRGCKNWRRECLTYRTRNGKVVKENDHAMDDTRYFCRAKIREGKVGGFVPFDRDIMPPG